MSNISIPEPARPGFIAISELSEKQIDELCDFIDASIDFKTDNFHNFLNKLVNNEEKSASIISTIYSFSELIEAKDVDSKILTSRLISSFLEQSKNDFPEVKIDLLRKNLEAIFSHSKNLRTRFKALDLLYREDSLFSNSEIITDIRLVFNDDIEKKNRNGLIIHHLNISYRKDRVPKTIALALDSSDLKNLQGKIERALKKEQLVREDYHSLINFLNFANDDTNE